MSTIPTCYHVIQEILGDLGGLPTPGTATNNDHLMRLQARYDGPRFSGDWETLAVLHALWREEHHSRCNTHYVEEDVPSAGLAHSLSDDSFLEPDHVNSGLLSQSKGIWQF